MSSSARWPSSSSRPDRTRGTCDSATCGDGVAEGGEACDGFDYNATTCGTFGYWGGSLTCTAAFAGMLLK